MNNENEFSKNIPNILIVDDVPINLEILGDILKEAGYRVKPVISGNLALREAEKEKPDLILLDIMMPDMDGYEVCRQLKENQNLSNIPVIYISALNDINDIVKAFTSGGVDYIIKPFQVEEVKARVATHLEIYRQNNELQRLNAEIKCCLLELESSKAFVEKQKEDIEKINNNVLQSINYAKRIQSAVFPQEEFINEYFPEHFVFFKPKDIVSGDFYWIKQVGEYIFLAVADCTGHGVPGAFMSMIGNAFLNEILVKGEFLKPGEILDRLRVLIKKTLHQSSINSKINDGMDIAMVKLNLQTRELEYAGARHPLIWIQKDMVTGHPVLNKIKGDTMPIGLYPKEKPFTTHKIPLAPDDTLYLFSDGFVDQSGGPDKTKYMTKHFIDFLTHLSNYNMQEQKERLSQELANWMKDDNQVDDILVVGIRILEKYGNVDLF